METPIEIFNGTHIELRRVIKYSGAYYFGKIYMFLADIKSVEGSFYGTEMKKCSKVWLEDGTYIKVSEPYKDIRDTHRIWWKQLQDKDAPDKV